MIPLRIHNIIDYVIAAVLVLTPYVLGFSSVDAARNVFGILGVSLAVYSLITDYRYSIAKIVPLGVHMAMDVITGVVLMLAPSIFGYSSQITGTQFGAHFVLGLGAVALVALTYPKSGRVTRARTEKPELRRVA